MSALARLQHRCHAVAYWITLSMAGVLLLLGGLGVVWRWLWGLLFDVPGLAVALLGWLLAVAGLLLTPNSQLRSGRTWMLVAALCVHTAVLSYLYEFLIFIIQFSSPTVDILVAAIVIRLFWLLRLHDLPGWLAWMISASLWPVWVFAGLHWLGGYTRASLITKRIANRTAQLANAVSPSFLQAYRDLLDTHLLAAWLGPTVIVVVILPALLLFAIRRPKPRT